MESRNIVLQKLRGFDKTALTCLNASLSTQRIFQQQSAGGNSFEKDEDYIRPGEFLKEVLIEDPLHSEKKTTIIPLVEVRPE